MKLLMVMAGGTGGHVYPALAIARELQQKGISVIWLGTREGLEAKVVPPQGIEIEWIEIKGVAGTGIVRWLKMPIQLSRAVLQSLTIFKRRKPDALLSMGGFVAGPGGIAGALMRKPLILHEANAIAGLTNKALALIATKIMCGFPATRGLPKNALVVGNPVREAIIKLHNSEKVSNVGRLKLLIVGGSQGAVSFNEILPLAIELIDESLRPLICHQTGHGRDKPVRNSYEQKAIEADVREYLDDMAQNYAWADIIICRAGAMTIAEITTVGLPALMIPYPYAAGDHQMFNAQFLESHKAARIIRHEDFKPETLAAELNVLIKDRSLLAQMGANSHSLAKINATQKASEICEQVLHA